MFGDCAENVLRPKEHDWPQKAEPSAMPSSNTKEWSDPFAANQKSDSKMNLCKSPGEF